VLAALVIWDFYVAAPWTRDGSVRAQVAGVAPLVSGQITEIRVVDNQYVHQGDVLYVIDPFDFQDALDTDRAMLRQKAADLQVKQVEAQRRQHLTELSTTAEEQQVFVGSAVQAQAAFDAAQQQLAQADINLKRTQVRSPVNGFVTNLLMRVGDFAHAGIINISVIDADSYWIDGYFEETKMAHVCVGDRAEAALMGYRDPIVGRVESVTRGISVSNAAPSTQGLPNVDPVYTWVRLAQRVPVRIQITHVPPGVPLVSGMTATITIRDAEARQPRGSPGRHRPGSAAVTRLRAADRQRDRCDRDPAHTQTRRTSQSRANQPRPRARYDPVTPDAVSRTLPAIVNPKMRYITCDALPSYEYPSPPFWQRYCCCPNLDLHWPSSRPRPLGKGTFMILRITSRRRLLPPRILRNK
jgi:multidrug resistance efflux pump